ncbi:hypothetical protein FFLO_04575 [Filobasidium floriforme]|uniref:Uncharacterized protein n=1 Tax=Filobasidium floriforme TaxID=5210 RepID=A0A8K0NPS2_9TREE|nr:uncharacterized protein HD553DRAFT_84013 [Filobasidium floriforme]KAG7531081.1 hypothetical protein FFLO_04575 [Filobasidium floriforme]KAH8081547.1 hypothetical protein HD553DRAFT_84013 [Filobasidium floriforme]
MVLVYRTRKSNLCDYLPIERATERTEPISQSPRDSYTELFYRLNMDDDRVYTLRCRGGQTVMVKKKLLLLSPVFRDMLIVGSPARDNTNDDSAQPRQNRSHLDTDEAYTITVDDDAKSLRLVFLLLDDVRYPEADLQDFEICDMNNVKALADKYDLSIVPSLLVGRLWEEVSREDGYDPLWVFAVAVHFRAHHLARYACSMGGSSDQPSCQYWWAIQKIGLEAYYILSAAENRCSMEGESFSWKAIAKDLVFLEDMDEDEKIVPDDWQRTISPLRPALLYQTRRVATYDKKENST